SSRRRHTRSKRDWSSDVCSSDLIQDIVIRYKRMQGYEANWIPGTDHASISTEAKVVEKLRNEGKTKKELGRDKFLEECWDWTEEIGRASCRERVYRTVDGGVRRR